MQLCVRVKAGWKPDSCHFLNPFALSKPETQDVNSPVLVGYRRVLPELPTMLAAQDACVGTGEDWTVLGSDTRCMAWDLAN